MQLDISVRLRTFIYHYMKKILLKKKKKENTKKKYRDIKLKLMLTKTIHR